MRFLSTLVIILYLISPKAQADDISSAQILKNVQSIYTDVKAIKARFEQTLFISLTEDTQVSKGTLLLQRPDLFHLDYSEPEPQLLISNGTKVWFYDSMMEQVIIRSAAVIDPTLNPLYFLMHVEDDYQSELIRSEKVAGRDCFLLKLTRKSDNAADGLEEMELWISQKQWLVRQFRVFNRNGDYTTYTLFDMELNPSPDTSKFEFSIPPGIEIIDES